MDCMYELAKTSENGHLSQRLFPLIVFDIDRSPKGLEQQQIYWIKELKKLSDEAKRLGPGYANICNNDIVRVNTIIHQLPLIWTYFKENLTSTKEKLMADGYKIMIDAIKGRINELRQVIHSN